MSKKIKGAKSTVKLNIKKVDAPQLITVSFCYLSKNKTRNFGFFGSKNIRQKADAFEQMLSFLQRLTLKTRADIAEIAKDRENADVNGAANILKKSRVVSLEELYCRGELSTPIRISVA